MTIYEEFEKRRKENEEGGSKTIYEEFEFRRKARNAENVANDIQERIQTWGTNYDVFVQNYQKRYAGRKGTYEDSYVSDSSDWLETITKQANNFDLEAQNILSVIDEYSDFFDADWVKQAKEYLTQAREHQNAILDVSVGDNNFWKQFKDENEYKTYAEWAKKDAEWMAVDVAKELGNYSLAVQYEEKITELESEYNKLSNTKKRGAVVYDPNSRTSTFHEYDNSSRMDEIEREISYCQSMIEILTGGRGTADFKLYLDDASTYQASRPESGLVEKYSSFDVAQGNANLLEAQTLQTRLTYQLYENEAEAEEYRARIDDLTEGMGLAGYEMFLLQAKELQENEEFMSLDISAELEKLNTLIGKRDSITTLDNQLLQENQILSSMLSQYGSLVNPDTGEPWKGHENNEEAIKASKLIKDQKNKIRSIEALIYTETNGKARNLEEFEQYIHEHKGYLTNVENTQTFIKLSEVVNNSDFEEYAQKGEGMDTSELDVYIKQPFSFQTVDKETGKIVAAKGRKRDYMTAKELKIYNYYIGRGDKKKASDYLELLEPTLTERAAKDYIEDTDNAVDALGLKASAAVDNVAQSLQGVWNFITGNDAYIPPTAVQIAASSEEVDQILGDVDLKWYNFKEGEWKDQDIFGRSLGQVTGDLVHTTVYQIPSTLLSFIPGAGPVLSRAYTGISAAGSAYNEMIGLGYRENQARLYGLLVGASEAGLSVLLDGTMHGSGKLTGFTKKKILSSINNVYARVAIDTVFNEIGEFTEESLQDVLEPWFKSIATNTDFEAPNLEDILYSGLLGALSASTLGNIDVTSDSTVAGAIATTIKGSRVKGLDGGVSRLAKLGRTFSADTVAYQIANKVNDKTGAYTIGRLLNEAKATLTAQNKSEIAKSLERKGFIGEHADAVVNALAAVVEGAELSPIAIMGLNGNPIIARTMRDVIINPNSTVNQRTKGLYDLTRGKSATVATDAANTVTGEAKTVETSESATAQESATQGKYEVSADGKTILKSTSEYVTPVEVVSIENGNVRVKLDNGKTVDASELAFATSDEALLYEMVARMGDVTPETATALIKNFKATDGVSAQTYALDIPLAYQYGKINYKDGLENLDLTIDQRQVAFQHGRNAAEANTDNQSVKNGESVLKSESKNGIVNKNESEAENENRESIHLRNGGERVGSTNTRGQVSPMESGTGQAESRRQNVRIADSEAARLVDEGREIKVASLGILGGSDQHTVRLVDKADETSLMKKARKRAEKRGLKVTFFVGDNLVIKDKSGEWISARAYIRGNYVFVRADHPLYTADQLMRHEIGHDRIAKGEVDINAVRKKLEDTVGKENVDAVAEFYADAYDGTKMSAEEIWEECICDSLGDMNIFAGEEITGAFFDIMLPKIKVAVSESNSPTQTRGSPESKASRETNQRKKHGKTVKYLSTSKVGADNMDYIKRQLAKLYGGLSDGIADGIAIENGNVVYIVDSGIEKGKINFGVRKTLTISNDVVRTDYVRRTNNDAVSKGNISDGLSSKFGDRHDNSRGSNLRRESGTELQADKGKSEDKQSGVLGEDADQRGLTEGKASREIDNAKNDVQSDNSDSVRGTKENDGDQNTKILGNKRISALSGSKDNIREHGKNTRTLKGLLGLSEKQLRGNNIRAGESKWLEDYQGSYGFGEPSDKQKARRFLQSARRRLSRIGLKSFDTVGREIPTDVIEKFSKTIFKAEDGTILSLWHWTDQIFNAFKLGDIGFHAGTFDASYAIMVDKSKAGEIGVFKELYVNSNNPLFVDRDVGKWTPHLLAAATNVFNDAEIDTLSKLDGYMNLKYDSEASIRTRELLKSKGYDAIIYTNDWEGGLSVIVFDNEQFYTVAENGIEVKGKASRELDSDGNPIKEIANNEVHGEVQVGEGNNDGRKLEYSRNIGNDREVSRREGNDSGRILLRDGRGEQATGVGGRNEVHDTVINQHGKTSRELDFIDYINDNTNVDERKSLSNREILADTLTSSIDTSTQEGQNELRKLKEYQEKIELIEKEEAHLAEIKAEIAKISFNKGTDRSKLSSLNDEKIKTANRIDHYDKLLMGLEAMKPIKNILEREKAAARKKAELKNKEALKAYREKAAEKQRELVARYQESRAKAVERRRETEYRNKIKDHKGKLESLLLHPTDKKYVPIGLVNAVIEVCELINTDTDLYKKDGSINKSQEERNLTKEKLRKLKDEYEKLGKHKDPTYKEEFDQDIYDYLTKLQEKFADKNINDMTLDELRELYEKIRNIEETLRDARKLIGWEDSRDVYETGDAIISEQTEIRNKRKKGKRNLGQKLNDKTLNYTLSPTL